MKSNKETVLDLYEAAAERQYPGKGNIGRKIVESAWDQPADGFVSQSRLSAMGYKIDERFAMNCVRQILERNRSVAAELLKLKN